MQYLLVDENITCSQENNWIGLSFVDTDLNGWNIGMAGNHLLVKMNWSDQLEKNNNSLSPRQVVSYFQKKCDDKLDYMGMNLLLDSINKGS